jgi:cytochrome c peroxidase
MLNSVEQAVPDSTCVVHRVCAALSYPVSFEEVWGTGACDIAWPGDVATACATEGAIVAPSAGDRAKSDMAYEDIALPMGGLRGLGRGQRLQLQT